jgi:hypothetical protein
MRSHEATAATRFTSPSPAGLTRVQPTDHSRWKRSAPNVRACHALRTVSVELQPGSSETPAPRHAVGLTEAEATSRLATMGARREPRTSRSYASIVRANVLTVFNAIIAAFGVVTLIFGDARDALFLAIIIANAGIGITQEVRAKRALDSSDEAVPTEPRDEPPRGLEPMGLVVLAEELRPTVHDTIAFLLGQGVEVKVLSGDNPQTVAAIARDVGIPVRGVSDGSSIPEEAAERRKFALAATRGGPDLPGGQAGDRPGVAQRRPLRGDGRGRRQRRTGAEELAARDRAGQRHADGAKRLRPGADLG